MIKKVMLLCWTQLNILAASLNSTVEMLHGIQHDS
jgi:hypothetical protein